MVAPRWSVVAWAWLAIFVALAAGSRGFVRTREMVAARAATPGNAVWLGEMGILFAKRMPAPPDLLAYWSSNSQTVYGIAGNVGYLKAGSTAEAAQDELRKLALEQRNWRQRYPYPRARVEMLRAKLSEPLVRYGSIAGTTALILLCLGNWRRPRYAFFYAGKALGFPLLACLAAWEAGPALDEAAAAWGFFVAMVLFASWCWYDQHGRCRDCLAWMVQPVRIGTAGSVLLEHAGTERICGEGHGTQYDPEVGAEYLQQETWTQWR